MHSIRSRITNINNTEALYILISNKDIFVPITKTISSTYEEYNTNGFILITVTKESTFGNNF